jgi:hypothetical protein
MSPEEIRPSDGYQNPEAARQSLTELSDQIVELAGHINAAHYRFLMLIAEWDQRKGWNDGASQSCAHWLNWKCGIDMGAAREKVRTAADAERDAPHMKKYAHDARALIDSIRLEKTPLDLREAELQRRFDVVDALFGSGAGVAVL